MKTIEIYDSTYKQIYEIITDLVPGGTIPELLNNLIRKYLNEKKCNDGMNLLLVAATYNIQDSDCLYCMKLYIPQSYPKYFSEFMELQKNVIDQIKKENPEYKEGTMIISNIISLIDDRPTTTNQ